MRNAILGSNTIAWRLASLAAAAALLTACASTPPAPKPAPPAKPAPAAKPTPAPSRAARPAPELKKSHPVHYVVKKGDTLWDIASRFLKDPWLWPDIWYVNPQIRNPHLIYPGDVIELRWVHGKPRLTLASSSIKHLHPQVHSTPIRQAVPTLPIADIGPFLAHAYVVTADQLDDAPYVVATGDGRTVVGAHGRVYVKGVEQGDGARWQLVRKGKALTDPQTDELLGYQTKWIGAGRIVKWSDPAAMTLTDTKRGAQTGDRLMPYTPASALPVNFYPHAPASDVKGRIVSVIGGASQIGQYDVVIIDRGKRDGIDPGTVFAIYQQGRTVDDPYSGDDVELPRRHAGMLMVFRSFDKVSYALVMKLDHEIHVLDQVRRP